jgi:RNA polymerase sigma-70 factor (ECF subfamily)
MRSSRHPQPRDEELLDAARQGDSAALEALVLRYQPRVYRFGMQLCGDVEQAGEVVQDTMLAMVRSLRQFRGEAAVSTWLYSIARSFCRKKRRERRFVPAQAGSPDLLGKGPAEEPLDPAPDPEQQAAGREIERLLAQAIASLEPAHREVLVLRDLEGLTAPEVAQVLGLSVEATKSRLHRARLALRRALAPRLGVPPAPPAAPGSRCPDVLHLFSRALEGDIDHAACAEMTAHLDECPRCRDACESLRRTLALCRSAPTPEVPAPIQARVRAALRAYLAAAP